MLRRTLVAAVFAALSATAFAQGAPPTMQPGQPVQLGMGLGQRTIRMVMLNDNGGGIDIVYDMAPGTPSSARVLRLENVNGMLQVIYDEAAPTMHLGAARGARLVQQGGGMYTVEYDRR